MDGSSNTDIGETLDFFTDVEVIDDDLFSNLIENTVINDVIQGAQEEANEKSNVAYSHDDMKNVSIQDFIEHYSKHGKKYLANKLDNSEGKSTNNDGMSNSNSSIISSTSDEDKQGRKIEIEMLPFVCCYCGVKKCEHHTTRHRYIGIRHEYACRKCGKFFYQHHKKYNKCTFYPYKYING